MHLTCFECEQLNERIDRGKYLRIAAFGVATESLAVEVFAHQKRDQDDKRPEEAHKSSAIVLDTEHAYEYNDAEVGAQAVGDKERRKD